MTIGQHMRPASSSKILPLAIGDVAVFFLFSGIGRLSHGQGVGIEDLGPLLANALPFAASYLVAGSLLGAYRNDLLARPLPLLARTLLAWAIALVPGVVLRMLILRAAFPPLSFALTTFIFVAVFLSGWRLVFAWLAGREARNGN